MQPEAARLFPEGLEDIPPTDECPIPYTIYGDEAHTHGERNTQIFSFNPVLTPVGSESLKSRFVMMVLPTFLMVGNPGPFKLTGLLSP